MHKDFKIIAKITRSYQAEDGKTYIEGVASNTDLDLTGERMDKSAILAMASALQKGAKVALKSEHLDYWDSTFGEAVQFSVDEDYRLHYRAALDMGFSKSRDLVHALNKGVQLGVSIGGHVIKAGMQWVEELGRAVYTYFDIDLQEISITSSPAVPATWVASVTRSINRNEVSMTTNKNDNQPQTTTVEVEVETPAPTDQPAPPREQPAPTEAPTNDTSVPEGGEVDKTDQPEGDNQSPAAPAEDAPEEQAEEEAGEAATTPSDPPQTDAPEGDRPSEETQKSRYLGEWADSAIGMSAIYTGHEHLTYALYSLLEDGRQSIAEKLTTATAMFDEYRDISLKILRTVLEGSADDAAKSLEALREPKRDELTKSLQDKDSELAEVTKALAARDEELTTLRKSLAEKDAELTTVKARKVLVFGKGYEIEPETDEARKSEEPSIGELWLQKQGALPDAA